MVYDVVVDVVLVVVDVVFVVVDVVFVVVYVYHKPPLLSGYRSVTLEDGIGLFVF